MLNKPTKVLIGKDITRTAAVVPGATMVTVAANAVQGEVIVFDKYKKVMPAGMLFDATDTIHIGQATGITYNYTSENGNAVTGARKIIFSDPIEGAHVIKYSGRPYTVNAQQVTTYVNTNLVVTAGTQLTIRLIYRDLQEQKGGGQFVHSYHYTCVTGDTVDSVAASFAALINKRSNTRVVATVNAGSDQLILTGLAIPSCTTSLDDIDEYTIVRFDSTWDYVDQSAGNVGYWQAANVTKTVVEAVVGNGTWYLVRDAEKAVQGYKGFTNQTTFPILKPAWSTEISGTYDTVTIESSRAYIAPDNSYTKNTPVKTLLFFRTSTTSNQADSVLAVLNPWMASLPRAFAPIPSF